MKVPSWRRTLLLGTITVISQQREADCSQRWMPIKHIKKHWLFAEVPFCFSHSEERSSGPDGQKTGSNPISDIRGRFELASVEPSGWSSWGLHNPSLRWNKGGISGDFTQRECRSHPLVEMHLNQEKCGFFSHFPSVSNAVAWVNTSLCNAASRSLKDEGFLTVSHRTFYLSAYFWLILQQELNHKSTADSKCSCFRRSDPRGEAAQMTNWSEISPSFRWLTCVWWAWWRPNHWTMEVFKLFPA